MVGKVTMYKGGPLTQVYRQTESLNQTELHWPDNQLKEAKKAIYM